MRQSTAVKVLAAGKNVFLTGTPGSGKTHLLNRFIGYLRDRNVVTAITAPTGIAATHIGGMTLHSWSGLGIRDSVDEKILEKLLSRSYLKKRFETTQVLIIDEVSMLTPGLFTAVNNILQNVRFSTEPFGGVQVVLTGDFFQLPPVEKRQAQEMEDFEAEEQTSRPRFVWQTETWKELDPQICYLSERHRHHDDNLIRLLDEMRLGRVSEESRTILDSCGRTKLTGYRPTRLYTHNIDVDRINENELSRLSGEIHTYSVVMKGKRPIAEKILNSSLVAEYLQIKKGALVLFIKNNFEKGFVNGTLGEVIDFEKESGYPIIRIKDGIEILAEMEEWSVADEAGKNLATIAQVPLRLAWAITVHKSQGMTLDAAEVDLEKAFEPGHGYVALSRVKDLKGLHLLGCNEMALRVDESVLQMDADMKKRSHFLEAETIHQPIVEKYPPLTDRQKKERFAPKVPTIEKTRLLLKENFTLEEIAHKRDLKISTLLAHLDQLSKLGVLPVSIKHLRPKKDIWDKVLCAIETIRKNGDPNSFTEKNEVRLGVIYRELEEKISYDDIKLVCILQKADS